MANASHLVVMLNDTELTCYVDGELVVPPISIFEEFCTDDDCSLSARWCGRAPVAMSAWAPLPPPPLPPPPFPLPPSRPEFNPESELQLFTFPLSELVSTFVPAYAGVYFLALYGEPLDAADVAANYQAGLLNSRPLVFELNETVNEDGEKVRLLRLQWAFGVGGPCGEGRAAGMPFIGRGPGRESLSASLAGLLAVVGKFASLQVGCLPMPPRPAAGLRRQLRHARGLRGGVPGQPPCHSGSRRLRPG